MDGSAPWRQTSWDWRAAGNLTFGGAGAGLAFCAAALGFATGEHNIAAFLLAPLLIAAGIGLAWAELGKPKDFLRVLFHPQTSWKSREALIAPVLLVAALVAAVLPFTLVLLLVLILSGGFLYVQGRILGEAGDTRIVPLVLSTGVAEGAALLTVVATLTFSDSAAAALRLTILLAALRWPVWTIYRDGLAQGASAQGAALRAFGESRVALVLWVPIAVLALAAVVPWFGWLLAVLGGLATAASGWWLKYLILTGSPSAKAFVAPLAPAKPADGEGTPG